MNPKSITKGDTIGIIAPSDYIKEKDLEYINQSIVLMEMLGLKVKFGKHVFENDLKYGTSSKKRAEDLNNMFVNKDIKAIICAKGGEDSNSILDYINFDIIKENPKIICGFSDNTSILNVISDKTGLTTFHGPTFKSFTSWETEYAYKQFIKFFINKDFSLGEKEDTYNIINEGQAEGELIGGNLFSFTKLVSGKYKINVKGKILFLEELGFESSPQMVNSNIYYLKQNGIFYQISGLWIGNYDHISNVKLEDIIKNALKGEINIPIIKSNNFGHIDKKMIIPINIKAKIDTKEKTKIKLVEKSLN